MKRINWLTLVMLACLAWRPALAAPLFPDVPDMWARDAVAALAAKGMLEGYPDGTFKGDRAASRYEVAMIVARLLASLEQQHATFASKADLDELRRLIAQLREELDSLGVRITRLDDDVARLDRRVTELERITFYGSLDARFNSMGIHNYGLSQGINGGPWGAAGGISSTVSAVGASGGYTAPGLVTLGALPINPAVGIPGYWGSAMLGGNPVIIAQFPWNSSSFNTPNRADGYPAMSPSVPRPSYNLVVGSNRSLGSNNIVDANWGNPLAGISGLVGQPYTVPMVLPTFDVLSGRPWVNGTGLSAQAVLGMRIKLTDDLDAGAEFGAYSAAGDTIVNAFYGVSAVRSANVFGSNQALLDAGQGSNNQPFTRMAIDNFWFLDKPTHIKVQLGAFSQIAMDDIVYVPEFNPNFWGPNTLSDWGFHISGEHFDSRFKWEVFQSWAASGTQEPDAGIAAGGNAYLPLLWGADARWSFGHGKHRGNVRLDFLRVQDENSIAGPASVGSIAGVNGVWTDWANPAGFFANQLNPGGGAGTASLVAGIGSLSDVRPILPNVVGNPQSTATVTVTTPNLPHAASFGNTFGTDTSGSGIFGSVAATGLFVMTGGGTNYINKWTSTFGPQSMTEWGGSAGYDWNARDAFKLHLTAKYSHSDYKPSANSSYRSPGGDAAKIEVGATLFENFDVNGEYLYVNPYHDPYILQYPTVDAITNIYWRFPSLAWFPDMYPIDDKEQYPNNREGFRLSLKWRPPDEYGRHRTAAWGEYGNMQQVDTSLQQVRFSPGNLGVGPSASLSSPNGFILGQLPGFVDTVFTGFAPTSFAGYTGDPAPSLVNQFAHPLENPRGRVTNWGVGVDYKFEHLKDLRLVASYRDYDFRRNSSLSPRFGGSENQENLNNSEGKISLQYPVTDRLAVKAGWSWTVVRGHTDPLGVFHNYAADTGSTTFDTVNQLQTAPFVGVDFDLARNVNINATAMWLDSEDRLSTFSTPNFFMQRNPFSWSGLLVSSQLRIGF